MSAAGELLAALVAGDTAVLHPAVVFVRGDGVRFEGRAAVCAMFARHDADGGARYAVVHRAEARVVVALTVPDVPGALHFALEGEGHDGLLVRVQVVAP